MEIFTIGYTAFEKKIFIEKLKEYEISCLIDVRSKPYSQYFKDFDKEILSEELKKNGILYRNYAFEFGARQENKEFYSYATEEKLNFSLFIKSPQFQSGIQKVKAGINMGYRFAFMCAEKDPINCHRSIMIGKGFKDAGFEVKHIKNVNSKNPGCPIRFKEIETQDELEQRLLEMYKPNRYQLSFDNFDSQKTENELISECYLIQNIKIGYKPGNESEGGDET